MPADESIHVVFFFVWLATLFGMLCCCAHSFNDSDTKKPETKIRPLFSESHAHQKGHDHRVHL